MAAESVVFDELVTSRSATGNSLSIKCLARGSQSTFDVRTAILLNPGQFPPSNGVDPVLWLNFTGVQIEQVDGLLDHWTVTVPYIFPNNKSERERREERQDYGWTWEIRGRVETTHITRSFETKRKKPGGTLETTNFRLIGYDQATGAINGTDVPVHATEIAVSFYMPTAMVTKAFRKEVRRAYDKVDNSGHLATMLGEDPKTVLLADANFSSDSANYQNVKVDYTFLIGEEVTIEVENVGTVIVPPHWAFETLTEEYKDPDLGIERARPIVALVHRVFEERDLAFLMPEAPSESGSGE